MNSSNLVSPHLIIELHAINLTIIKLEEEIEMKKINDHPEVADIKHICSVLPRTKITEGICDKVNQEKRIAAHLKKSKRRKWMLYKKK
jgi:hypothetical protein